MYQHKDFLRICDTSFELGWDSELILKRKVLVKIVTLFPFCRYFDLSPIPNLLMIGKRSRGAINHFKFAVLYVQSFYRLRY